MLTPLFGDEPSRRPDGLAVLDELEQIPVCIAYEVDGQVITQMPASTRKMEAIKPVFVADQTPVRVIGTPFVPNTNPRER